MDDQGSNRAREMTRGGVGVIAITAGSALAVLAIALSALGIYWSRDPEPFDVRANAASFAAAQERSASASASA